MLAECLSAWLPPPSDADAVDAQAGIFVFADVLLMIRNALKK